MFGDKYFWFEDGLVSDERTYVSRHYSRSDECKGAAEMFCILQKKDVQLISMRDGMGRAYALWRYNNGNPVYVRR